MAEALPYVISAIASYAVTSIASSDEPRLPQAPGQPPGLDPNAAAERDRASNDERARRVSTARATFNPLGGSGDISQPSLAAKQLLGQ